MEEIGLLYHWSPTVNRRAIFQDGLKTYVPGCVADIDPDEWAAGCSHISFGTSPSSAWQLSGALDYERVADIEQWDLWEAELGERDEVQVRSEFGPRIWEIKVYNPIPPDRLWWVGSRG